MSLDAHEIIPNLWQGAHPPEQEELRELGFEVCVFCAAEWQRPSHLFPGVECVYAPNQDSYIRKPTRGELNIAVKAAQKVAEDVTKGKRVLVTCWAGRNRSGLVVGLSLHFLLGLDGNECIRLVQTRRLSDGLALENPGFRHVLRRLGVKKSA